MKRVKKQVVPFDKYFDTWDALDKVLEAWDSPTRANMPKWMVEEMIPAINNARTVIGRKRLS